MMTKLQPWSRIPLHGNSWQVYESKTRLFAYLTRKVDHCHQGGIRQLRRDYCTSNGVAPSVLYRSSPSNLYSHHCRSSLPSFLIHSIQLNSHSSPSSKLLVAPITNINRAANAKVSPPKVAPVADKFSATQLEEEKPKPEKKVTTEDRILKEKRRRRRMKKGKKLDLQKLSQAVKMLEEDQIKHPIPRLETELPVVTRKNSKQRVAKPITLPTYSTTQSLVEAFGMTLKKFVQFARVVFPWFPTHISKRMLMKNGYGALPDIVYSYEEASKIARVLNFDPRLYTLNETDLIAVGKKGMVSRPPIIGILGHRDHGKTTLVDKLRGANVAAHEDFQITQETYCYTFPIERPTLAATTSAMNNAEFVKVEPHLFTIVDTPGHHTFTDMRVTGAALADFVLLIVAADEGVLEQTFESLQIATTATIPIITVITKIDKVGAKPQLIKDELRRLGATILPPTATSITRGQVVVIEISAQENINMDLLRDLLYRTTEKLNLRADARAVPRGVVVEAFKSEGRGNVIRVLGKVGSLRVGQSVVCELNSGTVKTIRDSSGNSISSALPGHCAELTGFDGLPSPLATFFVCSEKGAKHVNTQRLLEERYNKQEMFPKRIMMLNGEKIEIAEEEEEEEEELDENSADEGEIELKKKKVIVRANNVGSIDMINGCIEEINQKLGYPILETLVLEVGRVTKTDVIQASIDNTPIFAYRVPKTVPKDLETAFQLKVKIIESGHFQEMIDEIEKIARDALANAKSEAGKAKVKPPPKPRTFFETPLMNTNLPIGTDETDTEIEEADDSSEDTTLSDNYDTSEGEDQDENSDGDYINERSDEAQEQKEVTNTSKRHR